MRRLVVGISLFASLSTVPATIAQPMTARTAASGEVLGDPRTGRFSYLRSGVPVTLQASPLYAAALVTKTTDHEGSLTPPDGLELDPRGKKRSLVAPKPAVPVRPEKFTSRVKH